MNGSFTTPGETLVPAVKYASRWLDARPANPTLGGVVFDVSDGILTIASQGEQATARAVVEVGGDARGRFIVGGRLVDFLVSTLAGTAITFEHSDGSAAVGLRAGRYSATLPAMSENEYPGLSDTVPAVGTVEGTDLADAARRIGAVASRDGTQGVVYMGIHFRFDSSENELTLGATDRLRASRQTISWKPTDEGSPVVESFVLPAAVLVDAGEAFACADQVQIGWRGGVVSLVTPTRSLVTRTLGRTEEFPNLEAFFTQIDKRTHTATISVRAMMAPLKRAEELAATEHRHIGLNLWPNVLTLRSSTEGKGNGDEEIDIEYDGPHCTVMSRSAILHGVLGTAPGDVLTLHLTPNTYGSVFATSPDNPAWTHLFMPIRHT